jgi:hypothetical protein
MKNALSILAVLTLATVAKAQTVPDQYQVVPGQRLGRIFIGDSRATVTRRLGKPAKTFKLATELSSDLWRGSKRLDTAQSNTLEVIYRRGVVVQIETTNPVFKTKAGHNILSPGEEWNEFYNRPAISYFRYPKRGNLTYQYHDWKSDGLALELIETEDEPSPETLIVHRKGFRVIPDVGGLATR